MFAGICEHIFNTVTIIMLLGNRVVLSIKVSKNPRARQKGVYGKTL